ncbi:hypothetical protein WA026_009885, partial [Henosepilachna vigintioctopunctata]
MPNNAKPGGRKKPPATKSSITRKSPTPPRPRRSSTPISENSTQILNTTQNLNSTQNLDPRNTRKRVTKMSFISVPTQSASVSGTSPKASSSYNGDTSISSITSRGSDSSTNDTIAPGPKIFRYVVRNIPTQYKSQREFFKLLNSTSLKLSNLKVNFNQTALIECKTPAPIDFQKILQNVVGTPSISFTPLNNNAIRHSASKQSSKLSYSCVIKNVPLDYEIQEVNEALTASSIPFNRCWRIISQATSKPTTLIRVITHSKQAIDQLLLSGLNVYGRIHEAEPSRVPQPIQKFCSTCSQSGHDRSECTAKPICSSCGDNHKNSPCPKLKNPTCPNCRGNHPAWDLKCPKRREPPTTAKSTAPVKVLNESTEKRETAKPEDFT